MRSRSCVPLATIALLVLVACTTSSSVTSGSSPTITQSGPVRPGRVTGLRVQQATVWSSDPSKWGVVLHWNAPDPVPDHYEVIRNDKVIAKDVTTPVYTDVTAEPSTHYRYRVEARNATGAAGAPANATTKTGAPPLSTARLEGRFYTSLHVTSSSIGTSSGTDTWMFSPHCAKGSCDVTFSHTGSSVNGSLSQSGAAYTGTLSLPFRIRNCFGSAVNESITMHLTVYDAAEIHGEWRATRVSGNVHEYASYSGCVPATNDYTVKGTVQT